MITCNGSSLGYGLATIPAIPTPTNPSTLANPYLLTLLQGGRIPRIDQLPAIAPDPSAKTISCGPEVSK
jgi:hypothetical protein